MGKIQFPNYVIEENLFIIKKQIKVAKENENVALYEYKFCVLHPKGQRSPMGYDLMELSTGKTLKGVTNVNMSKIWRRSFVNFRNNILEQMNLETHLEPMLNYVKKTHHPKENEKNRHWIKELLLLEQKTNEGELKLFEKSLKEFSRCKMEQC